MTREEVAERAHRMANVERMRLMLLLGREPRAEEVSAALRESCIQWCESWFSDAERALPEEAQRALALQWLDETGVLATLAAVEEDELTRI